MAHLKDLLVAGPSRFIGEVAFNDNVTFNDSVTLNETLILAKNPQDAEGNAVGTPGLIIGNPSGQHIAIDDNEIIAKSSSNSSSTLYLNTDGGTVNVGGDLVPIGSKTLGTSSNKWKTLYVGDNAGSTSSDTGSIIVNGGIGTSGNSYIGGALVSNGAFTANSTALIKGAITGQSTITTSGTGQVGNTFTIKNANGSDSALIFDREGNANWKLLNTGGVLKFQCDWSSSKKGNYYSALELTHGSKLATFYGNVIPYGNANQTLGDTQHKWKTFYVGDGTDSTSTSTGAIQVNGGIGVTKAGYFGGDVTADQLHITNDSGVGHITFARGGYNYLQAKKAGGIIAFVVNGQNVGYEASEMIISDGEIFPGTSVVTNLGSASKRWKGVYGGVGDFSGNLTVSGTATIAQNTTIGNGVDSESTTTGALKVAGGVGISKCLNAKKVRIDNSVYFQYNNTDKSLDVIFG